MVIVIFCWCYRDRIIGISCIRTISFCSTTIIYCYSFTSCVFNGITGYGYFVFSTYITSSFTVCYRNVSNVCIVCCSGLFNYAFSRSCTACCIDFEYSFTAFSFLIYCNRGTSFRFHQTIVIKFNIYVSIFTVCIVFGYSCNTVVIAFNV